MAINRILETISMKTKSVRDLPIHLLFPLLLAGY